MADVKTHNVSKAFYHNTPPSMIGESPIYRASDNTLHWLDIFSRPCTLSILSLTPDGKPMGTARVVSTSLPVSCIRFVEELQTPEMMKKAKDKKDEEEGDDKPKYDDEEEDKPQRYICGYEHGIGSKSSF
jgi:hypothetical protein